MGIAGLFDPFQVKTYFFNFFLNKFVFDGFSNKTILTNDRYFSILQVKNIAGMRNDGRSIGTDKILSLSNTYY